MSIADDLRDGDIDRAAALLRYHILIINEWVGTFALGGERSTRKDKADDRDYSQLLNRGRTD